MTEINIKHCRGCDQQKPLSSFSINRVKADGLNYQCKDCINRKKRDYSKSPKYKDYLERSRQQRLEQKRNAYVKKYRFAQATPAGRETLRNYKRKYTYGITPERYNELLSEQNNKCLICEVEHSAEKPLAIDHCHASGIIRGLLCRGCNVGIGNLKDSIELLEKAIIYLSRF